MRKHIDHVEDLPSNISIDLGNVLRDNQTPELRTNRCQELMFTDWNRAKVTLKVLIWICSSRNILLTNPFSNPNKDFSSSDYSRWRHSRNYFPLCSSYICLSTNQPAKQVMTPTLSICVSVRQRFCWDSMCCNCIGCSKIYLFYINKNNSHSFPLNLILLAFQFSNELWNTV